MCGKILIIYLIAVSAVLQGCAAAESQTAQSQITRIEVNAIAPEPSNTLPETQEFANGKAEFKGVNLNYNPQIFVEAKAQEIPEQQLELETDIPDYVAPQYLVFTFKTRNQKEATVEIYPIDEYRRIWMPVDKNSTTNFDKNLSQLKKFIANNKFRVDGEIPAIPYRNDGQTFEAKVKNISFQSGKGVLFLTQRVQEKAIVNNGHLEYDFEGISEDGKYYILGQSSVKVSFLPNSYLAGKFEDYAIPNTVNWSKAELEKYNKYAVKITKRLENLPADQYEPNLNELENIISSLKIEK